MLDLMGKGLSGYELSDFRLKWNRWLRSLQGRKQSWMGLAVILFLLIVGVVLLVNIGRPQDWRKRAGEINRDGQLLLSSLSDLGNVQLDGTFYVDVTAFSQLYDIYGVDMKMQFDKERLNVIDIQPVGVEPGCDLGTGVVPLIHVPTTSDSDCTFKELERLTDANRYGRLVFGTIAFDWVKETPAPIPAATQATQIGKIGFLAKGVESTTSKEIGFSATAGGATDDTNIVTMLDTGSEADILDMNSLESLPVNVVALAPTGTPAPPISSLTLNPLLDTFISSGIKSADYGGSTELEVDTSSSGTPKEIALLKFDLKQLSGKRISYALLKVYVTNTSVNEQHIRLVTDQEWTDSFNFSDYENYEAANGKPFISSINLYTLEDGANSGSWAEFILPINEVQNWVGKNFSLAFIDSGTDGMDFSSRESSNPPNPPELVLNFVQPTPISIPSGNLTCGSYAVQSDGVVRQGASTTNGADTVSISSCYAWMKRQDLRATLCGTGVDYFEIVLVDSSKYSSQIPTLNMVTEFVHIEDCSVAVSPTAVPTATSVPPSPTSSVPTATPTPLKIAPTLTPTPTSIPTNTPVPTATPTPIKIAPTATPTQQIRSCSYCFKGVCDGKCNKAQEGSNCLDCP